MNGLYIQKKKKKNPLKRLVGLLIILLFFGLLFKGCLYSLHIVTSLKAFKIKEISVIAPPNIPKDRIISLSGLNTQTGLYEVSLSELKKRIRKDPWVKRVKIWRTIPSKIEFTITSKDVVALAKVNGSIYYIDDTGAVVDKLIVGYKNDLPVITVGTVKYMDVISVMDKLKTLGEISELSLDEQILTLYTSDTNIKVKLDMKNLDNSIALIKKVMADLNERHETPSGIDATLPGNKVVVRGLKKL
jgi:cell division septal protein FtsQ